MQSNYYIITQKRFYIAVKKSTLNERTNLANLILKNNDNATAIWSYKKISSNKKGFLIHLDFYFDQENIQFSNKGVLLVKDYTSRNTSFGLFTNQKVEEVNLEEEQAFPLDEKTKKKLPKGVLSGLFTHIHKKRNKYVFCLDVEVCFQAYHHLV